MKKILIIIGICAVFILGLSFIQALGCCFNPTNGQCSPNSEQDNCEALSGDFYNSATCSISQCNRGCCILGSGVEYLTSRTCEVISGQRGLEFNFQTISENDCYLISRAEEEGACLYGSYNPYDCVLSTREECHSGNFHAGLLCTAASLNTTCRKTTNTGLIEDKEEVYFKDSCGNLANIYNSILYSNSDYWTSIKTKSESCGAGNSNAESKTCGNCNYELGSIARKYESNFGGPVYGKYMCKDLNCVDSSGRFRANGASWCSLDNEIYDGAEGNFYVGTQWASRYGETDDGRKVPIPDVVQYVYSTSTGYKLKFNTYNMGDYWGGIPEGGWGIVYHPDGTNESIDVNSLVRLREAVSSTTGTTSTGSCSTSVTTSTGRIYTHANNAPWNAADCTSTCTSAGFSGGTVSNANEICTCSGGTSGASNTSCIQTCGGSHGEKMTWYTLSTTGRGEAITQYTDGWMPGSDDIVYATYQGLGMTGTLVGVSTSVLSYIKQPAIGSRYFRQYCQDGEVVIEPCGDYRMETCSSGECKVNNAADCISSDATTDDCDSDYCYIFKGGGTGLCGSTNNSYDTLSGLNFSKCLPKVPAGAMLSSSSSSSSSSSCSQADYTKSGTSIFKRSESEHRYYLYSNGLQNLALGPSQVGIFDISASSWWIDSGTSGQQTNTGWLCSPSNFLKSLGNAACLNDGPSRGEDYGCQYAACIRGGGSSIPIDPAISNILNTRCAATSDCSGDNLGDASCSLTSCGSNCNKAKVTCTIPSFSCDTYEPSISSNCEQCGANGLPCSEYKCSSLGSNCEYNEPQGADRGYCMSSSDNIPPVITLKKIDPASPIPPYTPAEFVITTNEDSRCKFNLNSAGGKYENMAYDFGNEGFAKEHSVILNLPGQVNGDEETATYPLMYGDLRTNLHHVIYVRCLDAAGNGEIMQPFTIPFDVMRTPDTLAPILSNFTPVSGSKIKFNTTSKFVTFNMNEPAQCKWDFYDKDFDLMNNSFQCDESITANALVRGYSCSGILTNVTLNGTVHQETREICSETSSGYSCRQETRTVAEQSGTKFYIRCKDQPWLEGRETQLYTRNKNDASIAYVLWPSDRLEITGAEPTGNVFLGSANTSITISVSTYGGAGFGRAICKWIMSNSSSFIGSPGFRNFFTTNSERHTQIVNPDVGDNFVQIKCTDTAENTVEKNISFNVAIDDSAPVIIRMYSNAGKLNIVTNEDSKCIVSMNRAEKCSFNRQNSTLMTGFEKIHTIAWKNDAYYYISCSDFFGNSNSGCTTELRTY
jgi:hypothetical protein